MQELNIELIRKHDYEWDMFVKNVKTVKTLNSYVQTEPNHRW